MTEADGGSRGQLPDGGASGRAVDSGPPDWVADAVFYQIFPDRFATSTAVPKPSNLEPWEDPPTVHGYKGGDLIGVVERLDHLAELGVSALYLNPVFQSASNHRYHTHDYYRVDPMLGGDEALRRLLDEAHGRGMRVILDGVFNHASRGFFQFSDILENGDKSAYLDWFHVESFPLNAYTGGKIGYRAWWDLPALPKFNTDTEAVREFLFDVGTYWLAFGIDGWRLDVPSEIDDDAFWREFRRRCRAVRPDCYIVGEIWGDASRWLRGDQFDAVMNYPLARTVFGFVAERLADEEIARSGYQRIPRIGARRVAADLAEHAERYPAPIVRSQLNVLGSHDTPRIRTVLGDDVDAVLLAFGLQMTLPGAPCIYYGDEIGLVGGHDPGCRQGMPWARREAWNERILRGITELAKLRAAHRPLRRGGFEVVHAAADVLAFTRGEGDEVLLVVANAGVGPATIDWEAPAALPSGVYEPVYGGGGRVAVRGGRMAAAAAEPEAAAEWSVATHGRAAADPDSSTAGDAAAWRVPGRRLVILRRVGAGTFVR